MEQFKYLNEFYCITEIYLNLKIERKEEKFFEEIFSDKKLIDSLQRFGLSKEDIEGILKDIFHFLNELENKNKIKEFIENLQKCPGLLSRDSFEEKKSFYRLCRKEEPDPIDFLPHPFEIEKVKRRKFYEGSGWLEKLNPEQKEVCKFFGISIHGTAEAARKLCKIFPKLKNTYSFIAELSLNPNSDGKVFFTPSRNNHQHFSWFPYAEVEEIRIVTKVFPL